ncbi:ubiquitin-conjugating enzyme E2 Z-like [Frankliniella occidentalis]|uniref:Ubiquitin-conjugating enzyme E2 Z n=1 Tax=Frankliniella occidentalis TaxID=133901 RepID=A0A9C6XT80_FRAOC|nr:ubiquitin-conjugating enzyme E2 Z-like [Frankliniella occidentalis]
MIDIASLMDNPPCGVTAHIDDEDFTIVHALISGATNTPYNGGFFYFILKCTSDYPLSPPKVKLMTTGAGTVRFNPNFYSCGKVCLSILGTWFGPGWLPSHTIEGVLISIQSVMCENPIYNEPGFDEEAEPLAVEQYNLYVQTKTLHSAVAAMLEETNLPQPLKHFIQRTFIQNFHMYEELAIRNMESVPKLLKLSTSAIARLASLYAKTSVSEENFKLRLDEETGFGENHASDGDPFRNTLNKRSMSPDIFEQ